MVEENQSVNCSKQWTRSILKRKVSPSFIMRRAKTRWTNSDLLEISLFSNLFQRYKFSLTQSEIPWLFTGFGVIYFYLTFCHLKQACLQLSCRKQWTIHLWNTCNLWLIIKTTKDGCHFQCPSSAVYKLNIIIFQMFRGHFGP